MPTLFFGRWPRGGWRRIPAETSMHISMVKPYRTAFIGLSAALAIAGGGVARAGETGIIPIPAMVTDLPGAVVIPDHAVIAVPAGDKAAVSDARWLAGAAGRDRGLILSVGEDAKAKIRLVRLGAEAGLVDEGYRLEVSEQGVTVSASSDAGLFYGTASLLQLVTPEDGRRGAVTIKARRIEDQPRFPWRGLMLDSARHFQSVAFIEALLDQMARYKLNTFHWHLTDDQGWRLEIKQYPRLTSVGAWRVEAGAAHQADIDPATGRPRRYGGFYTQDQVGEVVAYAKARGITVVPEIEMPGHASAAILAYPELGLRPVDPKTIADWGVLPNLYRPDDQTFTFLRNVLTEVMALFPGPYIHVGGDEAIKDYWKASPEVRAKIKALGLKDEDALQSWFIQRMEQFLAARGRRLIGWDEILAGSLPSGAVIMSWHGVSGAVEAAKTGHDAVLTPGLPFYFDNRQSDAADEPPGRGLIITLRNVYGFDPTPKTLDPVSKAHILGLQANVWTEHIRLDDRVEHMAFPRAVALAEMAWSPPEKRDWADFIARLPAAIRRDQALGLRPALSAFEIQSAEAFDSKADRVTVALSNQVGVGEMRFTLDGASPTPTSPLYAAPLTLKLPTTLRARTFWNGAALSPVTLRRFDERSVRYRDNHALRVCTDKVTLNLESDGPVASDHRAVVMMDLLNPCWLWKSADLSDIKAIAAEVGVFPFNYQIGDDAKAIPLSSPNTPEGELDVRMDACDGPLLVALPSTPAVAGGALATLRGDLPAVQGKHDLCFLFTRRELDPMRLLSSVQLEPGVRP
jgi:hexosaminidase